jgi:hypothetical protein
MVILMDSPVCPFKYFFIQFLSYQSLIFTFKKVLRLMGGVSVPWTVGRMTCSTDLRVDQGCKLFDFGEREREPV